jgi:hypothetical protein
MTAPANRPQFKVEGVADIKHLNIRKEGPEDEKILAVDLKMSIKDVDRRLLAYFDEALTSFLWREETSGMVVRNIFLEPVHYCNSITSATVTVDMTEFAGCEVKKFSIEPRDGGVFTLYVSVSIYPNAADLQDLSKTVQDTARIRIEGPLDLFTEAAPASAASTQQPLEGEADPMYEQAVAIVLKEQKASISLVQRHLKIGYNRAARLVEEMETRGIVSPVNGMGARTMLAGA